VSVDVVVDAGNSFVKWGRCSGGAVVEFVSLPAEDSQAWQNQIELWQIKGRNQFALTGSNPSRRDGMAAWLRKQGHAVRILDSYTQLPIRVDVKQPDKVGLDRLFNAVAVNTRKSKDSAAIIIDAGTAVTVDYVDEAGVFQGGAILPGFGIMAELLHRHTAALPQIMPEEGMQISGISQIPGKSTVEAMTLGITACYFGGVERLVDAYVQLGANNLILFMGGGDAPIFAKCFLTRDCRHWPTMTLEGIRIAAELMP